MDKYSARDRYLSWVDNIKDVDVSHNLAAMQGDDMVIEAAFGRLAFGTAGVRAFVGVGSGLINTYTIARLARSIALYLHERAQDRVVVCYDSRRDSESLACTIASVLARHSIVVVIGSEILPIPILSYSTVALRADMGIMVTASHNPIEYNGIKICDSEGKHIDDDIAREILDIYDKQDEPYISIDNICTNVHETIYSNCNISYIPSDIVDRYMFGVCSSGAMQGGISVVYTPLCGSGYRLVPRALQAIGVDVRLVDSQCVVDGMFVGCTSPNPERREVYNVAIELASAVHSDIIIATDPDCDRVGVAILQGSGYRLLCGNELATLLAVYMLESGVYCRDNDDNVDAMQLVIVSSIVSTSIVDDIMRVYSGKVVRAFVGAKNIAREIRAITMDSNARLLLGFEESGGLFFEGILDKDGIRASVIISQMVWFYKRQGLTLDDKLHAIYSKYGQRAYVSQAYKYPATAEIPHIIHVFRERDIVVLGGIKVTSKSYIVDPHSADCGIVAIRLECGSDVFVRASGTEPIVKVYLNMVGNDTIGKQVAILSDVEIALMHS